MDAEWTVPESTNEMWTPTVFMNMIQLQVAEVSAVPKIISGVTDYKLDRCILWSRFGNITEILELHIIPLQNCVLMIVQGMSL